ncbi:MAG: hypothetical protein JSS27_20640 [Planctomycetes bacterium]|nr:hypothetical protein [Planctomycetota bacterium]
MASAAPKQPANWGLPYVSKTPIAWRVAGQSLEGRPILVATFGAGTRRVLVVGPFSGLEPDGVAAAELLAAHLQQRPSNHVQITVVRDLNPDGHVRMMRGNGRGVDLEHDFAPPSGGQPATMINGRIVPAIAPRARQPETELLLGMLEAIRPDRIVLLGTAPAQSKATVAFGGSAEDLARQVTLEANARLLGVDADPTSLLGYCAQTFGAPSVRLAILPGASAEGIWEQNKAAILTATGVGTAMPLEAVAWPIKSRDLTIDLQAAGLSQPTATGPTGTLAPASADVYQRGGTNDDGAPPLRFRDLQHGLPAVRVERVVPSAVPQQPMGNAASYVPAPVPPQPAIPLNPAATPVPPINAYRAGR